MSAGQTTAPAQSLIGSHILVLREQRVMLDSDLAERGVGKQQDGHERGRSAEALPDEKE